MATTIQHQFYLRKIHLQGANCLLQEHLVPTKATLNPWSFHFLLPTIRRIASNDSMEIFIQHQGQQTGPFSMEQIQAGLANGTYQPSDLIWYQGVQGWIPVSNALQNLSNTASSSAGAPAASSGLALTSMILGISSFLCGVTSIPAVICGHIALVKIKRSQGRLAGSGFAVTGLITGYLGIFVFIAMMAAMTAPMVIRQKKKAEQAQAISNARQISYTLMDFKSEYGSFPNASTAPLVAEDTGTPAITDSSSNARFRQLFQAGITQSEEMFYAKSAGSRKPDGVIMGNQALAPSECGFGYIENISGDGGSQPIAMAPFKIGSQEFDPMPFAGKAVVLWSDGSVQSLPIDRITGEVMLDGQNLLDPAHPVWGGITPSLLLPE